MSRRKARRPRQLTLTFTEPEGFDTDEYPVHATVKVTTRFNGIAEPRQIELAVLIKPDIFRPGSATDSSSNCLFDDVVMQIILLR